MPARSDKRGILLIRYSLFLIVIVTGPWILPRQRRPSQAV